MERIQKYASDQVIIAWLADYTRFICDRFGLPPTEADGLLQQYLNSAARGPFEQPAVSASQQLTNSPKLQSSQHEAHFQEQPPGSPRTTHLPSPHLSYPASPFLHQEAHIVEDTNHPHNSMALRISDAQFQTQFSAYDQAPGSMMSTDSESAETGASSPQSTQSLNRRPVGKIGDYDPLWFQHQDVDVGAVATFSSRMRWDALFRHVIKIDDVLTIQVSVLNNGQSHTTKAYLAVVGHSRPGLPDLSITLLGDPDKQYPIAKACKTTNALTDHLHTCNITVLKSSWSNIQVFRGQQPLGSLRWATQAFHFWRDLKDREAQETGQFFRKRRRPAGKREAD